MLAVVENVENDSTQITLEDAKKRNPDAKVGDMIAEPLPPLISAASPRRTPSR